MNRIFKSIWNAKTRTFVAVSELTAARGKPATCVGGDPSLSPSASWSLRTLCAALVGVGLCTGGLALAQQITVGDAAPFAGESIVFTGPGSIEFVNGGTLSGLSDGDMTAGSTQAVTGGQLFQVDSALGTRIDGLGTDLTSLGTDLTDLTGRVTTVEGSVTSLTTRVTTTEGDVGTVTTRVQALEDQLYSAGDGVKYFRVNSELADSAATGENAVAAGPQATAAGDSSMAFGQEASVTATATSGIAFGQNAVVGTEGGNRDDGEGSVAIGRDSRASGNSTVALGDGAGVRSAFIDDAVAIGAGASVTGDLSHRAVALGANAQASGADATALGGNAQATADNAIALGNAQATASGALAGGNGAVAATPDSIALGTGAGEGTAPSAGLDRTSHVAIGTRAGQNVIGNQTTAIGFEAGNDVTGDWNVGIGAQAGTGLTGDENVAIGYQANQNGGAIQHSTALGSRANAGTDAVAIGYRANAVTNGSVAIGSDASVSSGLGVALGRGASAAGDNVALGANSAASPGDVQGAGYLTGSDFTGGTVVSVGSATSVPNGLQRRIVNVADGSQSTDAVNVRQLQSAQQSVANLVGNVPLNSDGTYGRITLIDVNGDAVEFATVTEALSGVTNGTVSILPPEAVRYNAGGQINNLAAGTLGTDAVNVEQLNEVVARNGMRYVSINATGLANEDNAGADGANAVAIGPEAVAAGLGGVALGFGSVSQANEATAVGYNTQALGVGSSVLGNGSTAYDAGSVAIGRNAISRGDNSVVMGTGAQADQKTPNDTVDNAIVIGTVAEVTADDGIAIGHSALTSHVRGIAQGANAHSEAVDATAIGTNALATGVNAYASGTRALASGESALASGTEARGYATNAIALGDNAISGMANPDPSEVPDNINTIAIGSSSRADARNAIALGREAQASGNLSLAIGDSTVVTGASSNAVGSNNQVIATNAGVLGNNNQLAANNAFIVGNDANVTVAGGVALGSNSESTTGAARAGYVPNTGNAANTARVNATTSTIGAVAVGSATVRRQITGLAAGTADSDAVNVAQLKSTGWNIQTDGDTPDHVSTGEGHTVDIGLATGETNLTVSRTTTPAGQTTIDYALAKNLDLGTAGSVQTGNSRIDNTGLTVNDGTQIVTRVGAGTLSVTNGTNTVSVNSGTGTVNGLTNRTFDPTDIVNGQAATEDQLRQVSAGLTTDGFGLTGADGNTVRAELGQAVAVVGGDTNVTTRVANGELQVSLADDVAVNNDLSVGGDTTLQGDLGVTGMTTLSGGTVIGNSLTVSPNTTINMGENRITGVAAGEDDLDAVNVSQLNAFATRPLTFTGNSGTVDRALGQTLAIEGGLDDAATASSANLRTRVDAASGTVVLEMANALTADSLTINNGGPSLSGTGLAMSDTQITGLADGTDDDHAVNLGQLKAVEDAANAGWNLGTNGDPAAQVASGDTVNLANTDGNVVLTQTGTDVSFDLADDVAIANDLTVGSTLNVAGNTTLQSDLSVGGDTTLQGTLGVTGLSTLTGGAVIGSSLTVNPNTTIAMGGNRITGIAPGTEDGDAVAYEQLTELALTPITFTGNTGSVERVLGETLAIEGGLDEDAQASSDNLRTRVTGNTVHLEMAEDLAVTSVSIRNGGPRMHADGIAMAGGQITGLANGTQGNHAVNLSQLTDVQDIAEMGWNLGTNGDTATNVEPGATVDFSNTDGNITIAQDGTYVRLRLSDSIAINNDLTVGGDARVSGFTTLAGGVRVSNRFEVAPGTTVNMGGNRIQNVAAGTALTDAVNLGQLQEVQQGVDTLSDRAVVYDGEVGDPKDRVALGGTTSTDGGRTGGTTITNLARGEISATSTDAVNGSQIHEIGTDIADGLGGNSTFVDGRLVTELNVGGNTYTSVNDALDGVNTRVDDAAEVASRGWDLQVNGDTASQVAPGSTVQFIEGENVTITREGLDVTVDVARDLKVDSVTAREIAIEDGPTINREGLDMVNQRIRNVADGVSPGDAVNVNQLNRLADGMNQQVNRLDARINLAEKRADAGVAAAMASATLPQAYMPGKSMFAMGGGTWNGETGFALGLSTVSDNGKWLVKGTGAGSSRGDYGAAVGVGYQW